MLPELKLAPSSSLLAPPSSCCFRRNLSFCDLSFFLDSLARARAVPGLGVREKFSNRRSRVLFLPSEPPIGVGSDIDGAIRCT